ncbi:hypothetical protein BJ912DRAFT_926211 [Pholiota molesta]|nr:hypothetical protein BJ912DRAFT_926209 [Pholiota molesta]KAF8189029.1 hypothetical protein BJ912DRAFT_926211 [Pholiota molesta]
MRKHVNARKKTVVPTATSPDPPPPPPATHPAPTTLTPKHHTAHIWQIKIAAPALMLFCHIPRAFLHFWQYVKGTACGERSGYARLCVYFGGCAGAGAGMSSVCHPAHADIGRGVQDFVERWKFWGQRLDEIAMNDEASEETRGNAKKMKEMMITTEA